MASKSSRIWMFLLVVSLLSINLTILAQAQEVSVAGPFLTINAVASSTALVFNDAPVDAVKPVSVACPRPLKQCALLVSLSTQVSGVTPGEIVVAQVLVDGSALNVLPANPVGIDSTSTGGASNARFIRWLIPNLQGGKQHTIRVRLSTATGTYAGSFSRVVTVDMSPQ